MAPRTHFLTLIVFIVCLGATAVQASSPANPESEAKEVQTSEKFVVATESKSPQTSEKTKDGEGDDCE